MTDARRTTVYLESDLHRALRLKAVETDRSISDLVNSAIRRSLAEDAEDLAAFEERAAESTIPYGDFVAALRRDGKI
ncbi:MAG: CopG family transcriptional regulator [Coriobacteriia bacterium]|nr:CopG family transcriptional regulator [Coriobacteriia bacterium]